MNIRSWLRRDPQPTTIRVQSATDGTKTLALVDGGRKWSDAERNVLALDPVRIEALNKDGEVLRAHDFGSAGADEKEERDESLTLSGEVGENKQLVLMARLLHEAHESGSARHEAAWASTRQAYEVAFTKFYEMVVMLVQRLTSAENAQQKQIASIVELQVALARAEAQGGGNDEMIKTLVQAAAPGLAGMLPSLLTSRPPVAPPAPAPPPHRNGRPPQVVPPPPQAAQPAPTSAPAKE